MKSLGQGNGRAPKVTIPSNIHAMLVTTLQSYTPLRGYVLCVLLYSFEELFSCSFFFQLLFAHQSCGGVESVYHFMFSGW